MNDLDLLKELGRVAREDEAAENARWERWEKWNDGKLSEDEEAELLALARTSPEAEAALEAFRPLGPEFRTRVLAAVDAEADKGQRRARLRFAPWFFWAASAAAGLVATAGVWLARLPAALPAYTYNAVVPVTAIQRGEHEVYEQGDSYIAKIQPKEEALPRDRQLTTTCFTQSEPPPKRLPAPCKVRERVPASGAMEVLFQVDPAAPTGPATLVIVLHDPRHALGPEDLSRLPLDRDTHDRHLVSLPKAIEVRAPTR